MAAFAPAFDFSSADSLMHQAVKEKVFPGAVLLLQKDGVVLLHQSYGVANIGTNRSVTLETIFDLASLTKPFVTTLSVLLLAQSGQLDLAQPVASVIPAFKETTKEKITIEHLLYHTSGLPAHRAYFKTISKLPLHHRRNALNALLVKEPLVQEVGKTSVYSDLGFMVLRWVVEKISGQRIDRFSGERIFQPLEIDDLFFVDLKGEKPSCDFAATEKCPWREYLLEGSVSDENAYAVGGVDGHAGIFGTAAAVANIMEELLATYKGRINKGLFQRDWLNRFFARDPHSQRALGFDMPTGEVSSSGTLFSKNSIGHLGFTGTSIWSDLDRDITVVLLTNRVHPSRENIKIKTFRPLIHDAVMTPLAAVRHGRYENATSHDS